MSGSDAPMPASAANPWTGRLRISSTCIVDLDELEWRFGPSGGPGGQHANKANTRAEIRFDVAASRSLTTTQRDLILERLGPVVTVIVDDTRSQARNRTLAVDRFKALLASGLVRPKSRRATKPSKASAQRRLDDKKRRGETKRDRGRPPAD